MYSKPKARKPIDLSMTIVDALVVMSEGNPGSITVMTSIMNEDPVTGFMKIMELDDMNIRGEQIWVAYKGYCESDITKLVKCITERSKAMVAKVNEQCLERYRAVPYGASNPDFVR